MHLREIQLRNWRSYRNVTFKIPAPKGKKKVILIGAMNGHGKTSFLISLYLGLFGREAMQFVEGVKLAANKDERVRGYRQLMQRILHRPALQQDDPHAFVRLFFEQGNESVDITRSWHYTKGGQLRDPDSPEGEEVRIATNERAIKLASWQEANNRVAELLFPSHVAPCFFFDGEQAQARVDAAGAVALGDAINTLFGTTLMRELGESLRSYVANQRSAIKRDVGDVREDELDHKRRRRDDIEAQIADKNKEIAKLRTEQDTTEAARQESLNELNQLVGDNLADLGQLSQKKHDLESEESELRSKLCDSLSNLALPIALRKLGAQAVAQLEAEKIRDRWQLLKDETITKVDHIVSKALPPANDPVLTPPLTGDQVALLEQRLRSALESLWIPPPSGCAEEYRYAFLSASDRQATAAQVQHRLNESTVGDVGSIAAQWQGVRAKVREVSRQWDTMHDLGPRLNEVKRRLGELDERVRDINARRTTLETAVRGLTSEVNDLRAAIGQMESIKRKLSPVEQKLETAERVREVFLDLSGKLVPLCKEGIETLCTKHFQAMISEEYRKHRVEFDNDLQPLLIGPNKDIVYITTLSGAQKRAFGLAFTLALAEFSGVEAPLVIDTPVGNLDSKYRARILKYLAENATGQVIFLSHDEEIEGIHAQELEPYILQKYLVEFQPISDGAGVSTVMDGRYFK
jgi:DNA sulfur modification protein DndD